LEIWLEVKSCSSKRAKHRSRLDRLDYYLQKTFCKTASLMANACKSAALLGDYPKELVDASYRYGKHLGIAFQLTDDVLDFKENASSLGKPVLADLKRGLATAPTLFVADQFHEMEVLLERRFSEEGDVDRALDMVRRSDGIARTNMLARVHAEAAMSAAMEFGDSVYRDALINLAYLAVDRKK